MCASSSSPWLPWILPTCSTCWQLPGRSALHCMQAQAVHALQTPASSLAFHPAWKDGHSCSNKLAMFHIAVQHNHLACICNKNSILCRLSGQGGSCLFETMDSWTSHISGAAPTILSATVLPCFPSSPVYHLLGSCRCLGWQHHWCPQDVVLDVLSLSVAGRAFGPSPGAYLDLHCGFSYNLAAAQSQHVGL